MKKLGKIYRRLVAKTINLKINPNAHILELNCQDGTLLTALNGQSRIGVEPNKELWDHKALPKYTHILEKTDMALKGTHIDTIILSNTLNTCDDVDEILQNAKTLANPKTRLIINAHNTLWRPIITLGQKLGLATKPKQENWLSGSDIRNMAELAGWEVVHQENKTLVPLQGAIATWINRWVGPTVPAFCLSMFITCRLKTKRKAKKISIVIPTRNEAGNIQEGIDRIPKFPGIETEVIFVEGNSTDDTWGKIEALPETYRGIKIIKAQQEGKGKGDAVRKGFSLATGDILLILDGDLTMPPEEIGKYIQALESGEAEFANGCRLVYNMDKKAMQLANLIANKCFGLGFSWILGQSIKDTLCGTKVLWREDYNKIQENRTYFGDFDPFGDFDLLFGAAKQNLKIRDIPIHYKERTYGSTNIQRWKHGVILLKMMLFAARKLKFT